MSKPDISVSSDYAVLSCDYGQFYYGYEETVRTEDEEEEWCFSAEYNGEKTIIPFSKLGAKDQCECVECLLLGIGMYLDSIGE